MQEEKWVWRGSEEDGTGDGLDFDGCDLLHK